MGPKGQYFRANTGLVVLNKEGDVLVLERIDVPGAWQLPQGGIDHGEEPIDAARRELFEETGIDSSNCELIAEYPEWLVYELPSTMRKEKTGRGQVQRWFIFRFLSDDTEINLKQDEPEFSQFRWVNVGEVVKLAAEFRRDAYKNVMDFVTFRQQS